MKTRIIIPIILLALMLLFGCKKENIQPNNGNGSAPTTGTLYFKNNQSDPYIIYLDNSNIGVLQSGNTSSGYTVTSGISHAVKAEQYSGYLLYPTVFNGTATLNPGGSVTWEF